MRTRLTILIVALFTALAVALPTPAYAWGNPDWCDRDGVDRYSHLNDWNVFASHYVRMQATACVDAELNYPVSFYSFLRWTAKPKITLPSYGPPMGDRVKVITPPTFYKVLRYGADRRHRVYEVQYYFEVENCWMTKPACSTFGFMAHINKTWSQICGVKGAGMTQTSCDRKKMW